MTRGATVNARAVPLAPEAPEGAAAPPPPRGWRGELALRFAPRGVRTAIVERRHVGPLVVQRAFYPEGGKVAHVYPLHPPGGLVGGDSLRLELNVEPGAGALLTTPAATKVYRCPEAPVQVVQEFRVAPGGVLEWLPQETIAFEGARFASDTRVRLSPGAGFIGWDLFCLGRPAAGEAFGHGSVVQALEVWEADRLLFKDRGVYRGGDALLDAPWGLGGRPAGALLVARTDDAGLVAAVREVPGEGLHGASHVNGILVARFLGHQAAHAMAWLRGAWSALRPHLVGRPAVPPRIWSC